MRDTETERKTEREREAGAQEREVIDSSFSLLVLVYYSNAFAVSHCSTWLVGD